MSGRRRFGRGGQLALMDAMVFFAVAMLASSVLLSYSRSQPLDPLGDADGAGDPAEVLRVFLRASVGAEIELWDGLTIAGCEPVADCLMAEACWISQGAAPSSFEELDIVLLAMLEKIVAPGLSPHLQVIDTVDGGQTVLRIERSPAASDVRVSATQEFPGVGGSGYLAVLVLDPSLLLQGGGV